MSISEQFTKGLSDVLAREIEGYQSLVSCQQLTAGASLETYRITYVSSDGEQRLALRRNQATLNNDSGGNISTIDIETEASLFQLAKSHDVPSPEVLYVLKAQDSLGSGFIMEWLEGETLGQRIVKADSLADIRPKLARQCGEILARIHAVDWQQEKLDELIPTYHAETMVNKAWEQYKSLNVAEPMIDYTCRWLLDNIPEVSRTTLVHSDFRNGNLMVNPHGVNAVLDWELAHIGDPIQDLGWLCVNSWRFGNSHLPVGGFGELEDLIAGYKAVSGVDVCQDALKFWITFGSFWWSTGTLTMASTWRTGETPSLERPVIGRRSSEAQIDCVNLLFPGEFSLPDLNRDINQGTQLPMAAELLDSVGRFLKDSVVGELDPHSNFLAKVAANSLSIVQRECQFGPELKAQEKGRLEKLLGQEGELDTLRWELVNRLRAGLALDTQGLQSHLRQTVAGQVAIDQPRYSGLNSSL